MSNPLPIQHDEVPTILKEAGFLRSDDCPLGAIEYSLGGDIKYFLRCCGWVVMEGGLNIMIRGDLIGLLPYPCVTDYSDMLEQLEQTCGVLPNEIAWSESEEDGRSISINLMAHVNADNATPSTCKQMLREASATLFGVALSAIGSAFKMGYEPGTTTDRALDKTMEMNDANEYRQRLISQRSQGTQSSPYSRVAVQDGVAG